MKRNKFIIGLMLFIFSVFSYIDIVNAENTILETNIITAYRLNTYLGVFSNDDLILISNYFTDYYKDSGIIKVATIPEGFYHFNSSKFDKENIYIFVFDYYEEQEYKRCSGKYCFSGIYDFTKNYDVFSFNTIEHTIELTDLTYTDVTGSSFNNTLQQSAYDLYTAFMSGNSYYFSIPLWFNENPIFNNVYDGYQMHFIISNSVILPERLTNYYDFRNYIVGENPKLYSYIDYVFGRYEDRVYSYQVNYYFDNVLNEELSYSGETKIGEVIEVVPDKVFNNHLLSNDNSYTITISDNENDNIINIYYIPNNDINTDESFMYFFINFSDLKDIFPYINFGEFSHSEQFLVLVVVNIFFVLFWGFVIWIMLKMLYKFFQWI